MSSDHGFTPYLYFILCNIYIHVDEGEQPSVKSKLGVTQNHVRSHRVRCGNDPGGIASQSTTKETGVSEVRTSDDFKVTDA